MLSRLAGFVTSVIRNQRRQFNWPRLLTYTVTFGCNARCIMCDSWKMPTAGDLTLSEIENIFGQLPQMDAVRLTGGEPFIRRDLSEIAQVIDDHLRPLILHMTTNGFLTDRIVEFCELRSKRTPLDLLISMDGIREKHNQVRGHSRAFDSCMETIKALAPRRRELKLHIAVNQTIVDAEGASHYARLREVLRPFGIQNHVVMAYDSSATYNLERDVDVAPTEVGKFTTFGTFTTDEIRRLLDEVESDLDQYSWPLRLAKRYYIQGIRNRLVGGGQAVPNPKCVALTSHLRIFPNGDIPTCQFNSRIVGNLRTTSFDEIWTSIQAETQRKWVKRCAGCWAECEVLPNAIYTGDLLRVAR